MYNATLKYIKTQIYENRYNNNFNIAKLLNYRNLRTNKLKNIKNDIIDNSQLPNHAKNTKLKCHMLDTAIQLACANYKSALSNFKAGNIKNFRIRYWKLNKYKKLLDIEKQYFNRGSFCYNELGNIKCVYDNEIFKLDNITSACKIYYDSDTDRYQLLIPERTEMIETNHTKKVISLDPGLRKFMTGLSENECITICTNGIEVLMELLKRIDEIENNKNIPNKKKKVLVKRLNRKISDKVDDLHWKTIKYLTDKYETIIIGDMSVKGIVSNDTSNIQKMMKSLAYKLKFYQFKQRIIEIVYCHIINTNIYNYKC
jgi:putative transposase